MKTLLQKIKVSNEDNPYVYLTGEEFTALVNMRKVKHFRVDAGVRRWTEIDGNVYYSAVSGSLSISRPQAKEIAQGFADWSTNKEDGKPLFAKVYISEWDSDKDKSLYVSM